MARLLGIDAGKTVVRAALVRTSYRRMVLEALGEAHVEASGSLTEAMRVAAAGLKPDTCAVALSGEQSFYRRLELPAAAQKELANVLGFELEATVPFEISDAVFDYRLLRREPGSHVVPIFAALARTDDVRQRIAVVSEALGQEPARVGTGALPLTNLTAVMPELERPFGGDDAATGPVAILELGEAHSDVVVMQGGEAIFARTLSRGTIGLPGTAPALARELRQTFSAFRAADGAPLAGMYLVGGGASTQGAEHFLSTELGITILPLPTPRFEGITAEQQQMLPRFAKAVGLAVGLAGRARGLDLRRGPLEAERSYPFLREKVPLLAGLGAVILVSFGFSVVAEMRSLDAERESLVAQLASTTKEVFGEETDDPDKARVLLEQGPGAGDEDPMPRVDAFDVMVALSEAVPKEVTHDIVDLDVNRGHVILQGTVPTNKDAEGIAEQMKAKKCFKDVKISRTNQSGDNKQKYVLELDLKCDDVKKPKTGTSPAGSSAAQPPAPAADTEGGR